MKRLTCLSMMFGLLIGTVGAEEMFYVIKVTPALVYLDGGAVAGVENQDRYLILRPKGKGNLYAQVGEVRIIRVSEEFSIAEIVSVAPGEEIEVLQQAISMADWEDMAQTATVKSRGADVDETAREESGSRFVQILAGGDWAKGTDLVQDAQGVIYSGVDRANDPALGLRLGNFFGDRWRLTLTYRMAGRVLGGGDVTQITMEVDVHHLFRGRGLGGPYLGAGLGMNRLTWDADKPYLDSTSKAGFNLVGGWEFPLGQGDWSLLCETGYQWVMPWGTDRLEASNVRTYAGLGRNF